MSNEKMKSIAGWSSIPLWMLLSAALIGACKDGGLDFTPRKHCLGGVIYYQWDRAAVVGYNQDGTLARCVNI